MKPEVDSHRKQKHTFDGPAEEYINEYDADDNENGAHSRKIPKVVPAPTPKVQTKKGVLTTLGKILSFLHS